jgi:NTP pyrophosphatase (non-canonical NTP hydrolase)
VCWLRGWVKLCRTGLDGGENDASLIAIFVDRDCAKGHYAMLVAEYDAFVRATDQSAEKSLNDRWDIAIYGLVGEIGSVLSAVKKELLGAGAEISRLATDEIKEELGDVLWYSFSLAQMNSNKRNILSQDIADLQVELSGEGEWAAKFRAALDPAKRDEFLEASKTFPDAGDITFDDYQNLAFLTARTDRKVLSEVCLAVLWQLGAPLLRKKLPDIELELNTAVAEKPVERALGEIAWHVSALARLYGLSLDDIAEANKKKVSFRMTRGDPTPLHDDKAYRDQRFPRQFEIAFLTVGKGHSRMYMNGRQIGDELTDNSYDDDGYRFHDVLHLANAAILGWSPVLRAVLGIKRKYDPRIDEVEDGARATIVEEAIVKVIHSEGARLAGHPAERVQFFSQRSDITFRFLNLIQTFVIGLEVEKSKYWEWEDAIMAGHKVFYELNQEEQGTVTVDLDTRTITFRPEVYVDLSGTVSGIGSVMIDIKAHTAPGEDITSPATIERARQASVKRAILQAVGHEEPSAELLSMIDVKMIDRRRTSIKTTGSLRSEIWDRKIITFRTMLSELGQTISCTALALSDARDALPSTRGEKQGA